EGVKYIDATAEELAVQQKQAIVSAARGPASIAAPSATSAPAPIVRLGSVAAAQMQLEQQQQKQQEQEHQSGVDAHGFPMLPSLPLHERTTSRLFDLYLSYQ